MSVSVKYSPFSKKKPKRGFSGKSFAGSYAFPAYSDCTTSTTNGNIFYAEEPTIALATKLYTDAELTVPFGSASGYILKEPGLENGVIIDTDYAGFISVFTRCNAETTLYSNCGNDTPTPHYTRYNDALAIGTTVYTDSGLTIPVNGSSLFLNGVIYSTDSFGVITIITYCTTPISPVYSNCSDYNNNQSPFNLYVRDTDYASPLVNGTKVYSDVNGISELGNTYFVWSNNVYGYSGGTYLDSQCNT